MVLLSLFKSLVSLITFRLRFPHDFKDKTIRMEDGLQFKIFRQMQLKTKNHVTPGTILVVRFRFKKYSHERNMRLSRIPILLIAGFPGFRYKMWMIDWETGFWQGVYEFEDSVAIEKYRKSFVLGLMNRRAADNTVTYHIIPDTNIDDYVRSRIINPLEEVHC